MTDDTTPKRADILAVEQVFTIKRLEGTKSWLIFEEYVTCADLCDSHEDLRKQLGAAEENVLFYRREWESACERYNYATEERDELKAKLKLCREVSAIKEERVFALKVERDALKQQVERLKSLDDDYGKLYADYTNLINSGPERHRENMLKAKVEKLRGDLHAILDTIISAKEYLKPDLVEPGRTVFWALVKARGVCKSAIDSLKETE